MQVLYLLAPSLLRVGDLTVKLVPNWLPGFQAGKGSGPAMQRFPLGAGFQAAWRAGCVGARRGAGAAQVGGGA
jgi:hypothetical protein